MTDETPKMLPPELPGLAPEERRALRPLLHKLAAAIVEVAGAVQAHAWDVHGDPEGDDPPAEVLAAAQAVADDGKRLHLLGGALALIADELGDFVDHPPPVLSRGHLEVMVRPIGACVRSMLPEGVGFVLGIADLGQRGSLAYAGTVDRPGGAALLRELAAALERPQRRTDA